MTNRIIKFRAWDLKKKVMRYPLLKDWSLEYLVYDQETESFFEGSTSNEYYEQSYMDGGIYPYKKSILMEFTGLKDKNGVEIYEGDILKFEDSKILSIVEFNKDESPNTVIGFKLNNGRLDIDWYGTSKSRLVIGNIYENPELLKGGEDELE